MVGKVPIPRVGDPFDRAFHLPIVRANEIEFSERIHGLPQQKAAGVSGGFAH
jgi:hypothetical protein